MIIVDLLRNPYFAGPGAGWLFAQVLKAVIYAAANRDFKKGRLVGAGGMPSSHSATVCALATVAAIRDGVGGHVFPICFFLACIVIFDALGVRNETGKQARVLNEIMARRKRTPEEPAPERLEEFVGHKPAEVIVGAAIGIALGVAATVIL